MATKELMNSKATNGIIPFTDNLPDYLPSGVKNSGMENFEKDDFKTPRIVILQALSPQLQSFPETARPGQFWHTGLNVSLGDAFTFTPITASKRVVLWRPRSDQEGGMLAFSRNGKDWDIGGNEKFEVKLQGKKERVTWDTSDSVANSGLTDWGTYDPDDSDSPPAATIAYEYLCYLHDYPQLSPCVLGLSKTGITNGKNFNTSLLTITRTGKPLYCLAAKCFSEEQTNAMGTWTVPNFTMMGYVPKEIMQVCKELAETYSNYQVEYTQETEPIINDEIKY